MIVIFGRNNHWISRLVRWRTSAPWSHVGMIDGDSVLEAMGPIGVKLTPISEFEARYTHTERRYLPGNLEKAKAKLGAPFDTRGLWGIFFKRKDSHDINGWFCSELVAYASDAISDEYAHYITPIIIYWLSKRLPG